MKIAKIAIRTIVYLSISIIFFLELVNIVQFVKIDNKTTVSVDKVFNLKEEEKKISDQISQMQNILITATLQKQFNLQKEDKSVVENNEYQYSLLETIKSRYIFFDYLLKNNNKVIPLIYLIVLITFLLQVILLSLSNSYQMLNNYLTEKKLDSIFLYSSEWAVNAPPVLGVIGTIYAFSMVVGNLQDMSSLSTVFKDNFSNAALTTIIGGSVYCLNLMINIFIAKNLALEK